MRLALVALVSLVLGAAAGAAGTWFLLRWSPMAGVPTSPADHVVHVHNDRARPATVYIDPGGPFDLEGGTPNGSGGVLVKSNGSEFIKPTLYSLAPGESLTLRGETVDMPGALYKGSALQFAASDVWDHGTTVTAIDQPTDMIEFQSGEWNVSLFDDPTSGWMTARIESVAPTDAKGLLERFSPSASPEKYHRFIEQWGAPSAPVSPAQGG